jgi:hypothetical protein
VDEDLDEHTLWNCKAHDMAYEFAETCAALRSTRPVPEADELRHTVGTLVTELWDRNFSITEIRKAFLEALEDLPRYAAGYDSRSLEAAAWEAKEKDKLGR